MKRIDLSREVKAELWRLFDAGMNVSAVTISGHRLPLEAVEKQRQLWQEYRARNPKR